MREAFRQLEAQGLVRIYPNRGAVVTKLTLQEMDDLMDVRAMLEVGALRLAIPRMTDEIFETAQSIIDTEWQTSEAYRLEELNNKFHFTLYGPTNNKMLFQYLEQLHANVDRYIRAYYNETENYIVSKQQHIQLLAACREREIDKACNLLYEHIASTKQVLEPRMAE